MKNIQFVILSLLCGLPTGSSLYAQTRATGETVLTDSAQIRFHQSRSLLDLDFGDNRESLTRMTDWLRQSQSTDSALRISGIRVVGAASPEGNVRINYTLSHNRANRIFEYFSAVTALPDSVTHFDFVGRDWQGLLELVKNDKNLPYYDETVSTISDIIADVNASGEDTEANLLKIKRLHSGIPYRYMYDRYFPELRYSRLYVDYSLLNPRLVPDIGRPVFVPSAPAVTPVSLSMIPQPAEEQRPFYMALKTNMLYDALLLPNIGAEFYVGKDWSVAADWMYGWWDNDRTHYYWRAYGGDVTVRRWFGNAAKEKPLTGHHLGVYAGVVTYDFELGGKGYMGGIPSRTLWDRCNYVAGIEYGYSLPIARRLNIDFTIGFGYLGGKVIEYVPKDEIYIWQRTRRLNWIGPTKAEISLVWLIGCGNYNHGKGGHIK